MRSIKVIPEKVSSMQTAYILSSWINVGLSVFFPKEDSLQERSEHNRDGKRAS